MTVFLEDRALRIAMNDADEHVLLAFLRDEFYEGELIALATGASRLASDARRVAARKGIERRRDEGVQNG